MLEVEVREPVALDQADAWPRPTVRQGRREQHSQQPHPSHAALPESDPDLHRQILSEIVVLVP
eukprot:SAG11_NODE_14133_length_624_cov_0.735238_1_plen_62_part_10